MNPSGNKGHKYEVTHYSEMSDQFEFSKNYFTTMIIPSHKQSSNNIRYTIWNGIQFKSHTSMVCVSYTISDQTQIDIFTL